MVVVVVVVVVVARLVVVGAVVKDGRVVVVEDDVTIVSASPVLQDTANRRAPINNGRRRIYETLRLRRNCADVA